MQRRGRNCNAPTRLTVRHSSRPAAILSLAHQGKPVTKQVYLALSADGIKPPAMQGLEAMMYAAAEAPGGAGGAAAFGTAAATSGAGPAHAVTQVSGAARGSNCGRAAAQVQRCAAAACVVHNCFGRAPSHCPSKADLRPPALATQETAAPKPAARRFVARHAKPQLPPRVVTSVVDGLRAIYMQKVRTAAHTVCAAGLQALALRPAWQPTGRAVATCKPSLARVAIRLPCASPAAPATPCLVCLTALPACAAARCVRWRSSTASTPFTAARCSRATSTPSPACCCWASTPLVGGCAG